MLTRYGLRILWVSLVLLAALPAWSAPDEDPFAVAVLGFESDDPELGPIARQLPDLLAAELSSQPGLILVERRALDSALGELELGLSGTVQPETAAAIGRLVGAKALVAGRIFYLGSELVATARVIGTQTSRVHVERAAIPSGQPVSDLALQLGEKLATSLVEKRSALLGAASEASDPVEKLATLTKGRKLPTLSVAIEETHQGQHALDPAAQTELELILSKLGFRLVEPSEHGRAEIRIRGEAVSEVGLRRGNLVSASGRVEIQAVDAESQEILAVDRQTELAVDLSEQIAAKKALQKASARVSERLVAALLER